MVGGITVSPVTVRAALATVEAADAATSLTELPALVLPALMDLIGADCALWTEIIPSDGPLPRRTVLYPEPWLDLDAGAALEKHAGDFPLTRHTRPGGDGRPIRWSDLGTMRSLRNSGMYADVVRKTSIDQFLAMSLKPGNLHVCISLNRSGRDFTPAAVDLLSQLRPLLTRRVERLAAAGADRVAMGGWASWPGLADLTTRQQQVLRLVADGLTDAAIGRRLGCSPKTVTKHLEHVYRRLGVSCRAAAVTAARSELSDGTFRLTGEISGDECRPLTGRS